MTVFGQPPRPQRPRQAEREAREEELIGNIDPDSSWQEGYNHLWATEITPPVERGGSPGRRLRRRTDGGGGRVKTRRGRWLEEGGGGWGMVVGETGLVDGWMWG